MISITVVTALALAAGAPSPAASGQARKAYSVCIQKVIKDKTEAKLSADAFGAAVKTDCASQESAFTKAVVAYEMGMGSKRADAEESARSQVEDTLANASDTYSTYTSDPK